MAGETQTAKVDKNEDKEAIAAQKLHNQELQASAEKPSLFARPEDVKFREAREKESTAVRGMDSKARSKIVGEHMKADPERDRVNKVLRDNREQIQAAIDKERSVQPLPKRETHNQTKRVEIGNANSATTRSTESLLKPIIKTESSIFGRRSVKMDFGDRGSTETQAAQTGQAEVQENITQAEAEDANTGRETQRSKPEAQRKFEENQKQLIRDFEKTIQRLKAETKKLEGKAELIRDLLSGDLSETSRTALQKELEETGNTLISKNESIKSLKASKKEVQARLNGGYEKVQQRTDKLNSRINQQTASERARQSPRGETLRGLLAQAFRDWRAGRIETKADIARSRADLALTRGGAERRRTKANLLESQASVLRSGGAKGNENMTYEQFKQQSAAQRAEAEQTAQGRGNEQQVRPGAAAA